MFISFAFYMLSEVKITSKSQKMLRIEARNSVITISWEICRRVFHNADIQGVKLHDGTTKYRGSSLRFINSTQFNRSFETTLSWTIKNA